MRLGRQKARSGQQARVAAGGSSHYKNVRFDDSHLVYDVLFSDQAVSDYWSGHHYNNCRHAANCDFRRASLFSIESGHLQN
jgi:hypothetical protein